MGGAMTSLLKLLLLSWTCWNSSSAKKAASDRSYQLGLPIVNGAQGIHFYASSGSPGLVFPNVNVPASVYIPGQIGVLNLPSGLSQSSSINHPTESTPSYAPTYSPPRPSYTPYGQQQSSPSFSIEQSVDLTDSTPPAPVPSTYGPPKTVDLQYRRPHIHRTYHRAKGHSHPPRGSRPPSGRPTYYTHMHKGHYHTHYIGPSQSFYKSPKPSYLPPSPPSTTASPSTEIPPPLYNPHSHPSTEPPQHLYNHHAHPSGPPSGTSGGLVRFPDSPSHAELTQAVIGQPGVINNYDANLPVKIPKPKPNQLEVKEILKNADLHFVDVLENLPSTTSSPLGAQGQAPQSPAQPSPYPGVNFFEQRYPISQLYSPQQESGQQNSAYAQFLQQSNKNALQGFRPYAELYDQRFQVSPNFQNNHLEQDLGKSETVKIPVAIFKGVVPSMFPFQVKRSDTITTSMESKPTDFVPSKSTSDWIPVTGVPKSEKVRNLNQFGDDYFADLNRQSNSAKQSKKNTESETSYADQSGSQKFSPPKAEQLVGDSFVYGISQPSSSGGSFFDNQQGAGNFFTSKPAETSKESEIISGSNFFGSQSGSSGVGGSFRDYTLRPTESKKSEKVGDIISGRIPGDHNPFAVIGGENTGGVRDRRVVTGNVADGGSASTANFRDSSNLVVSSVIKFSR